MTETTVRTRPLRWEVPAGSLARGAVVVFGGRGETPDVYGRFGSRLAVDSYRVLAFGDEPEAGVSELATIVREWFAQQEPTPPGFAAPLTLVGSDVGVLRAIDVATALGDDVDAVVLAGYPVAAASAVASADWATELRERTSCPLHQRLLDADVNIERGAFAREIEGGTLERDLGALSPVVLAVHGGEDRISPLDEVLPLYRSARDGQVWLIDGAKHDVLNDGAHRTVAAVIVEFLEGRRTSSKRSAARLVS